MSYLELYHPDLGTLELRGKPFTVVNFTIGSRAPRPVPRNRALQDGGYDDGYFAGARAVTVGLVLNEDDPRCNPTTDMQDLYDLIMPYMVARRRPVLSWQVPGARGARRQLTVKGVDAPTVISRRRHPGLVCQFTAPEGEITSVTAPITVAITPGTDVELGRTYGTYPAGQTYDKTYPASLAPGDRIIVNPGNEQAHYVAILYGDCINPSLKINGTTINFNNNGGLTLPAGSSVVIDTRAKTIYLNGDPTSPRYDRTNFSAWSWQDVMLKGGQNLVRFAGGTLNTGAQASITFLPTWAG